MFSFCLPILLWLLRLSFKWYFLEFHLRKKLQVLFYLVFNVGFAGGSDGKESAWNAEVLCLIPGLGRSPRKESGYPLQYSCLENFMDRGACKLQTMGLQKYRIYCILLNMWKHTIWNNKKKPEIKSHYKEQ